MKSCHVRRKEAARYGVGLRKRERLQGEEADGDKPHLEKGVGPVTHWRNCKQVRMAGASAQRRGRVVRSWTGSQASRVTLKG